MIPCLFVSMDLCLRKRHQGEELHAHEEHGWDTIVIEPACVFVWHGSPNTYRPGSESQNEEHLMTFTCSSRERHGFEEGEA
eukprot:3475402-Amphidinium_carterae.1